jgi:hypothetical protein
MIKHEARANAAQLFRGSGDVRTRTGTRLVANNVGTNHELVASASNDGAVRNRLSVSNVPLSRVGLRAHLQRSLRAHSGRQASRGPGATRLPCLGRDLGQT